MANRDNHKILVASYLEPELVEQVRRVDPRVTVTYEPEMLPAPRYAADHGGKPLERSPAQEARWQEHLRETDILFDFDRSHADDLPELAPKLRWIQATSSGIGQFIQRYDYAKRLPDTIFTTAKGVHAQPLAEFCLMSMLMFTKKLHRMQRDQQTKVWKRFAGTDLAGRTLGIVGVGAIGQELARLAKAFRMSVIGTKRRVEGLTAGDLWLDELYRSDELQRVLPRAEFLVIVTPHTPETENLIGKSELASMPKGSVLINIGRGPVVDESALIKALVSGHLAGASLDVFETEPLPETSPLWAMPNVLISPHSSSTSDRENQRITDLFCNNIERFLSGQPMVNRFDAKALY